MDRQVPAFASEGWMGLTKREYIAAMMMHAIVSNKNSPDAAQTAKQAVKLTEALINHISATEPKPENSPFEGAAEE